MKNGWGGRIRTCECRYQKPVPYHLATPQSDAEHKTGNAVPQEQAGRTSLNRYYHAGKGISRLYLVKRYREFFLEECKLLYS